MQHVETSTALWDFGPTVWSYRMSMHMKRPASDMPLDATNIGIHAPGLSVATLHYSPRCDVVCMLLPDCRQPTSILVLQFLLLRVDGLTY